MEKIHREPPVGGPLGLRKLVLGGTPSSCPREGWPGHKGPDQIEPLLGPVPVDLDVPLLYSTSVSGWPLNSTTQSGLALTLSTTLFRPP
jgi:hypothetical protein